MLKQKPPKPSLETEQCFTKNGKSREVLRAFPPIGELGSVIYLEDGKQTHCSAEEWLKWANGADVKKVSHTEKNG